MAVATTSRAVCKSRRRRGGGGDISENGDFCFEVNIKTVIRFFLKSGTNFQIQIEHKIFSVMVKL